MHLQNGNLITLFLKRIMTKCIFFLEKTVSVEFARNAPNAMKPLHLTSGSVGSDLSD